MTQEQYNLICKILATGAPALANELISAMSSLINDYNRLKQAEDDCETASDKVSE